jgi:hypothetical protein
MALPQSEDYAANASEHSAYANERLMMPYTGEG